MLGRVLIFLLMSVWPVWAAAQSAPATEAFARGDYQGALAALGAVKTSPDAQAFAARALLAEAMCGAGEPSPDTLSAAIKYADAALAQNPAHMEGRLQKAIALALTVRTMDLRAAFKSKSGETARTLAEDVIARDPKNYYAQGFLSVWHIEVVRRGGAMGAMALGASLKHAHAHYDLAVGTGKDDASLHWQYARALAALDVQKHRIRIDAALSAAAAVKAETALEQVMQARAKTLAELLAADDVAAAGAYALKTL